MRQPRLDQPASSAHWSGLHWLPHIRSPDRVTDLLRIATVLFKLRVVGLVTFTALVSMAVAEQGAIHPLRMAHLALAGTLAAAGAAALNHYLDRDLDAIMDRTQRRPLPARELPPSTALGLGVGLVAAGLVLTTGLGSGVTLFVLLAVVTYVVAYTAWLKRRTAWNVVIGGWTGSCAVLAGWTAAAGAPLVSVTGWALAAVVFLWTPAHFWGFAIAYLEDYRRAAIPMLPVVEGGRRAAYAILLGAVLTVAASLLPLAVGGLGLAHLVVAVLAGGTFVGSSARLCRRLTASRAWRVYKLSGLYLLILFGGMLIDSLLL